MTEVVEERTAIRRLSQYRLLEAGGRSAREAKEDLIVATLAEVGGDSPSIAECAESMRPFGLCTTTTLSSPIRLPTSFAITE